MAIAHGLLLRTAYFLKYVQAASTNKTIVKIQSDELLIPVFLAMDDILGLIPASARDQEVHSTTVKTDNFVNQTGDAEKDASGL